MFLLLFTRADLFIEDFYVLLDVDDEGAESGGQHADLLPEGEDKEV